MLIFISFFNNQMDRKSRPLIRLDFFSFVVVQQDRFFTSIVVLVVESSINIGQPMFPYKLWCLICALVMHIFTPKKLHQRSFFLSATDKGSIFVADNQILAFFQLALLLNHSAALKVRGAIYSCLHFPLANLLSQLCFYCFVIYTYALVLALALGLSFVISVSLSFLRAYLIIKR